MMKEIKVAEDGKEVFIRNLTKDITAMKKKIEADRFSYIREKLSQNRIKLAIISSELATLAKSRQDDCSDNDTAENNNMLSLRKSNILWKLNDSTDSGFLEKDNTSSSCREELASSGIVLGKCTFHPNKIPFVEKIPPYTTWIFLARNQRMVDEQSVVGRRQIYYDQLCGETIICSDSETEMAEPEEEKHDFSEGEDLILCKVLNEYGNDHEVINILRQFINATSFEISERYENLSIKHQDKNIMCSGGSLEEIEREQFLNRTLSAVLDSYDNLFCRRCFTFDCRLHGCSQVLILPSEKQPLNIDSDDMEKPCGDHCYILRNGTQDSCNVVSTSASTCNKDHFIVTPVSEAENSNPSDISTKLLSYNVDASLGFPNKKQKLNEDTDSIEAHHENQNKQSVEANGNPSKMVIPPSEVKLNVLEEEEDGLNDVPTTVVPSDSSREWKPFEKDLFLKGLEIFGRNSCLVARNLFSGLKTCTEVYRYMFHDCDTVLNRSMMTMNSNSRNNTTDPDYMEGMPARARTWRRRGKARKLKYTWKSTGHPSIRKRIADGKERCKKYVPCGCQQMCGKECPCHKNSTCCEKYCGCSKSCKNRFRGCHCAKSQCMSRQCPCYAAGRECDPDVCRNCWVSCGDASLGEPPSRGDDYQCGNMKLLLRQQEKILLGKSDVAGWGAFIKNPVNKHAYLGEYTGELISHKEADKRGKIYDRSNSSFLFDLNDQYVLDAYRKGDKLKFANHSSNPNCYAKIMLVAGDHRVGIFANERIEASEELFYDYRYGDDEAPAWARKPEGSKRDELVSSSHNNKRAYKIA